MTGMQNMRGRHNIEIHTTIITIIIIKQEIYEMPTMWLKVLNNTD